MAKLYGTTDRQQAHAKLASILKGGKHPRACCIEDHNDEQEPYQVHSEPPPPHVSPPAPQRAAEPRLLAFDAEQLEELATLIAEKVAARLKKGGRK